MRLFSWNVNGIRAVINKGEFASFLQTYDPDILCLQETKAARDQVEIDLPEYHEHFYSAAKKGYSGRAVLAYLEELELVKPVLYCGDMNVAHAEIDLANPKANAGKHGFTDEEREGFQNYLDAGFVDTFRAAFPERTGAYTWWTHWANARARNVGWRIDYWLASREIAERVANPEIHPEQMGSDHCPVSIEVEV